MSDKDTREILGFLAIVTASVIAMVLLRPTPPGSLTRTPIPVPEGQAFHPRVGLFDVSRDGSLMVYRRQRDDGVSELWARRLAEPSATPIPGTEGAVLPAISPDGGEVAFTAAGSPARIRVAAIQGGALRTIADSAAPGGVRWSPDGAWVYYTNAALGLSRVPSQGGPPQILTRTDVTETREMHWGVEVLPGGSAIAYTSSLAGGVDPRIEVLSMDEGDVRDVWPGSFPRFSDTGHLLFMGPAGGTLLAAPIDVDELELRDAPAPVVSGMAHPGGRPLFSVSRTGMIVYARLLGGVDVVPVWVERDGTAREVDPGWSHRGHATFSSLALSPDDDRLALSIPHPEGTWDLWVKPLDAVEGALSRITFEGAFNYRPTWSPDGRSLTFISDRAGQPDLWTKDVDGSGAAERILDRQGVIRNGFYALNGGWMVFREGEAPVADIFAIRSGEDAEAVPVVATEFGERSPRLSPNGRWLAFTSLESGEWHVWVTAFLEQDSGKWHVSPDGGQEPVWAHSGRELFYRNRANELVAAEVGEDSTFHVAGQQVLFSMEDYLGSDGRAQYDVSSEDERFVMLRLEDGGDIGLVKVEYAFEEFRPPAGN